MTLVETLREHERAWNERPLLRRIYREWFALVASRLAPANGPTVELGSGLGRLREVVPAVRTTDVEPTPWADEVVDAAALPYGAGEVGNLVLVDVFHHLPRPAAFLDEARRVLEAGGRAVLLEPYCSPLSNLAYRHLHHEDLDLSAAPFDGDPAVAADPMDANIALPTIAFFRRRSELEQRWPELRVVETRLLTFVLYPLSGGFSKRRLVPAALYRPLTLLERALAPLGRAAAFRCLVVLERR